MIAFVWLKCTLCKFNLLVNVVIICKALFFTILVHICLYGSHVWGSAVTASHRPYQAARVGPRPGQSDVSLVSSGWTAVRPASARGAEKRQKHPLLPLTYLPPSALSLSTLRCLFSGRPGFLCDGALDERRKRGMGLKGKDRHRKRWMVMGWRSCARSDLGENLFRQIVIFFSYRFKCKQL